MTGFSKNSVTAPDLRNMRKVQQMHIEGRKAQGQLILMPSGRNENRIAIPGQARTLLGFAWMCDRIGSGGNTISPTTLFTLALNNDIIIQDASLFLFMPTAAAGGSGNVIAGEFFKYLRPLSGADVLIVSTNNPIADTFRTIFQFHYTDK